MELTLEATDLESLTLDKKEALLLALLAACARGTEHVEPPAMKRFLEAAAQLPMVLNPHALEELAEAGKIQYDAVDDEGFQGWFAEIAAKLAAPELGEKVVVTLSQAAEGTTDPPCLSGEQTDALLCGLLVASAGGSTLDAAGVQRFRAATAKLPDLLGAQGLGEKLASANDGYDAASSPSVASWLGEIAGLVSDLKLRNTTLAAIGHTAVEATSESVSWFFDHVSSKFRIAPHRMALLRQVRAGASSRHSPGWPLLNPMSSGSLTAAVDSSAVQLDGATNYIEVDTSFGEITGQITVEMWMRGEPREAHLFYATDAGRNTRLLSAHVPWTDGYVYFDGGMDPGGDYDRIADALSPIDDKSTWNHWAFVRDAVAGRMAIYRNGALWSEQATGLTRPMTGITRLVIGADGTTNSRHAGAITAFRLWSRARTEAEIRDNMKRRTPASTLNLALAYPLRVASSTVTDSSGRNRHGALRGNLVTVPGPSGLV